MQLLSFTEENYLKAIYKLYEHSNTDVYTNSIAEKLNTKASTVTDMLKKLADKKLLNYQKYQGVTLTDEGKKLAVGIIRKHRLWEVFLVEKLNFKWDEIHTIAEELEHITSEELIERLDKFLNYPKYDPHGDPIPDKHGKFIYQKSCVLADCENGSKVIMTGVIDHSPSFLRYLDTLGLKLGDALLIKELFDFDRSMNISHNKVSKFISNDVARNILVVKE